MARRALKGINWAAIAERVPESEKLNYVTFKAKSDQYMRRLAEFPETAPKINWSLYKQNVPVPGMVDKFQKEYESLKIPYPVDNYTSLLDEQEKTIEVEIKNFIEESNKRIVEYTAEADKLKALIPFEQMTMEDFAEAYPEQAINLDRPTIWPHDEESQPTDRDVAEPMPKNEH